MTQASLTIREQRGTAAMVHDNEGVCTTITLDALVEKYKDFSQANFLKIDTDGYDYKVIRGARNLLVLGKQAVPFF